MGTEKKRQSINKQSPEKMVKSALEILFKSTTSNGFFPGDLDMSTKQPVLFDKEEYRDSYFHTSFEIPYILLTRAREIKKIYEPEKSDESQQAGPLEVGRESLGKIERAIPRPEGFPVTDKPVDHTIDKAVQTMALREDLREIAEQAIPQTKHHPVAGELVDHSVDNVAQKVVAMRKHIPFGGLVDLSSIVEVEEEWLYSYPSFLIQEKEKEIQLETIKDKVGSPSNEKTAGYSQAVVVKAAEAVLAKAAEERTDKLREALSDGKKTALIVDTGKKERSKRDKNTQHVIPHLTMLSNLGLWNKLCEPRTADKAKKRFIWLPRASDETALVCYLASTDDDGEDLAIGRFFDRHANHDVFFFDDTTMVKNIWESEFHLSFFQLARRKKPARGIPAPSKFELSGKSGRELTRASMGFRFFGDFFDRYWTCHYIEHVPNSSSPQWESLELDRLGQDRSWRQRKVLELHLFNRMLTELTKSTQEILNEVQQQPGLNSAGMTDFTALNSEEYFSSRDQWQKLLRILQLAADNLQAVLKEVDKWKTREEDRRAEQPRWTPKDETKYRGVIRKLEATADRQVRGIQSYQEQITNLKDTLTTSRDNIRDDLSLQGSENIRFFTYVTVVFLPLGFATSIFSSGASPAPPVLANITILAVVTLLVTVAALLNIRTINFIIGLVSLQVHRYSSAKMLDSYIGRPESPESRMRRKSRERRKMRERETPETPEDRAARAMRAMRERAGYSDSYSSSTDSSNDDPKARRSKEGEESSRETSPVSLQRQLQSIDGNWHVWFWIPYILIELPARRMLLACRALWNDGFSRTAMLPVAAGVVLLPVFIVSWLIRFCILTVLDILILLWSEFIPAASFFPPYSPLFFLVGFFLTCRGKNQNAWPGSSPSCFATKTTLPEWESRPRPKDT
jgi:hypothetical protein